MFLSQLILNPRNRRVQRRVADVYQMHRTLMNAFPADLKEGDERVLFRVESDARTGQLTVLLQSRMPPDWSFLATSDFRGFLMPVAEPNPAFKPFRLNLAAGLVLAFRLRANPTVKRRFETGDHKRVGIYGQEKQVEWLKRKGELAGFRLLSARTITQDDVRRTITQKGRKRALKLTAVQFDGLLQVTDPDRLSQSVREGIGSGKGFGFGLLSLARPPA